MLPYIYFNGYHKDAFALRAKNAAIVIKSLKVYK